jgi:hypothetical protein
VEVSDPDPRELEELIDGADADRLLPVLAHPDGNGRAPVPEEGVLDEPDSAKSAQRSSHIGPTGYKGWTHFLTM